MITAHAMGDDGTEIILLGITRENVSRLLAGEPIYVTPESHGLPAHLKIAIFYGENERALAEQLQPLVGTDTKVVAMPREKGEAN